MTPDLKAPEGCVILGYGGTFKVPGRSKQKIRCWAYNEKIGQRWMEGYWWVDDPEYIFAAPADSEVARMNAKTLLKCTRCRKTSTADPDKLVCPQCGEDYSPEKPGGSETPRTDEFIEYSVRTDHNWWTFARALERELAEATQRDLAHREMARLQLSNLSDDLASRDALIGELVGALRSARPCLDTDKDLSDREMASVHPAIRSRRGALRRVESALRRADGKERDGLALCLQESRTVPPESKGGEH